MALFTNIAFLAAAQGIFLSLVLLFLQRGHRQANTFLALLILVFSLWTAEFAAYFTTHFYSVPHLLFSVDALPLLFGPLLLFYAQSLSGKNPFHNKWNLLHFLPLLLHLCQQMPFFLESIAFKTEALRELRDMHHPPTFSTTFYVMESGKFLHLMIYLYFINWSVQAKPEKIKLPPLYQRWVKRLIYGLLLFAVFDLSHLLSIYLFQYDYLFDLARLMLLSSAFMMYYIGYSTLNQPALIAGEVAILPQNSTQNGVRYEKSALKQEQAQKLVKQLLEHMENEKPWLDSNLRLVNLAQSLSISKHHLSQLLNESLQQNFYDFVNGYRVKAAQQMLADPDFDQYTILAIAFDAGFKSKASFNTAFKNHCGMTPSAFKKKEKNRGKD